MYVFSFAGADNGRLAKNMPAGCIVRSSVTGKFFVCCVGFSGILTLIVADWTFHESWVFGLNSHGDHLIFCTERAILYSAR